MLAKISLLFKTVRHLKAKQLQYQVVYRLRKPGALKAYSCSFVPEKLAFLLFNEYPPVFIAAKEDNSFTFLNLEVQFGSEIGWSYSRHGKLWNYNLQYGNYLLQEDIPLQKRVEWLKSLYAWLQEGTLPLEPYPASLRTINTIRLLSRHQLANKDIVASLYAELNFLFRRPEYHLMGNHLLENAFALLMGGAFFAAPLWVEKGIKILQTELDEQILSDGAHFELSPMYHQIILFRLLELIDWYSQWNEREENFLAFLKGKAGIMMAWMENITFRNGDIPHFNDSAPGIAFSSGYLLDCGKRLGIEKPKGVRLEASGYRKFNGDKYECVIDVAEVGASYQPGHAHADALSFILYANNKPLFVEWGTSTYQIGERRSQERATAAHNTLVISGEDQSEVWGGFRVARRARVSISKDDEKSLTASHNGYQRQGYIHHREFIFEKAGVAITDRLEKSNGKEVEKIVYFHVHPDRAVRLEEKNIFIDSYCTMKFEGAVDVALGSYEMAEGYNTYKKGVRVKVKMEDIMATSIRFN